MREIKRILGFVILASAIVFLRGAQGSTLEYALGASSVALFWYLMGLKLAFDNIRIILVITLIFASIMILARIFFPSYAHSSAHWDSLSELGVQSSEGITGVSGSGGLELNPARLGLIHRKHQVELQLQLDKKPEGKGRYMEMGSLSHTENGIQYFGNPKKMDISKFPKTYAWAKEHLQGKSLEEDTKKIQRVLANNFGYTLAPGELTSPTPLDEFFFEKKKGFCEHFATTTCTLLKISGGDYKARVVYGYAGGVWNPLIHTLTYYSNDAHVWVEIYNKQTKQFEIIDPTAWVTSSLEEKTMEVAGEMGNSYSLVILPSIILLCIGGLILNKKKEDNKKRNGRGAKVELGYKKRDLLLSKVRRIENAHRLSPPPPSLLLSERITRILDAIESGGSGGSGVSGGSRGSLAKELCTELQDYLDLYKE
jgi:hypothetical protein